MSHSNIQSTCNPSDLIFHYRSPVPPDCIKLPMIFWFTVFLLSLLLFCTRTPSIHSTHFLIFIFCLCLPFVEQILRKSWSKAGRGGGKGIEWQKEMWSGIRVPDCNSIGSPGDCGIGQTASKVLHRQGQTRLTSSQLPTAGGHLFLFRSTFTLIISARPAVFTTRFWLTIFVHFTLNKEDYSSEN